MPSPLARPERGPFGTALAVLKTKSVHIGTRIRRIGIQRHVPMMYVFSTRIQERELTYHSNINAKEMAMIVISSGATKLPNAIESRTQEVK